MNETQYYRIDSLELSLRDVWRWRPVHLPLLTVYKLLGKRVPNLYWPSPALIEALGASPPADSPLAPSVAALAREVEAEGFRLVFYHRAPQLTKNQALAALLQSDDRRTLVVCSASRAIVGSAMATSTQVACLSRLTSGRELGTANTRSLLPAHPSVDVVRLASRRADDVVRAHRARLPGQALQTFEASPPALLQELRSAGRKWIAFLVGRGLLIPMTEAEVAAARQAT
jgi:hypothetical protein